MSTSTGRAQRVPALVAIGSIITVAFMGSVVVTPLYPLLQDELGFSEITLTLIYAVYVIGNVAALLLFGQISDQIGRKRLALPALGLAAVSAVLFALAASTVYLFLGRLFISLAVGVASGTGTAWLAEGLGVLTTLTDPLVGSIVFAATIAALGIGALMWRRSFAVSGHPREQHRPQMT